MHLMKDLTECPLFYEALTGDLIQCKNGHALCEGFATYIHKLNQNDIKIYLFTNSVSSKEYFRRYIQNVNKAMCILCHDDQENSHKHLNWIENCLNELPNETTKLTPNESHFGESNQVF